MKNKTRITLNLTRLDHWPIYKYKQNYEIENYLKKSTSLSISLETGCASDERRRRRRNNHHELATPLFSTFSLQSLVPDTSGTSWITVQPPSYNCEGGREGKKKTRTRGGNEVVERGGVIFLPSSKSKMAETAGTSFISTKRRVTQ